MKNPSVNSIVERLRAHVNDRGGCFKDDEGNIVIPNGAWSMMLEAATIISELQAELWHTKNDLANAHDNYHEVSTRLESSLSRIKEESAETLRPFADALSLAEAKAPSDMQVRLELCREGLTLYEFGNVRKLLTAIRSLGSTGGAGAEDRSTQKDTSSSAVTSSLSLTPLIMNGDQVAFEVEHANTPLQDRPDWPLPSFDARDWAQAFCKVANEHGLKDGDGNPVDEGWMIGWFSNALMRGFDEHYAQDRL